MTNLISRIEQFLTPVLEARGLNIVRVLLSGSKRPCLQVMIERQDETLLTMEDCVNASREISLILDVEDPIDGPYRLEVTSPGLDRPLTKSKDYQRFVGEKVKIQTHLSIEGRRKFTGILTAADEESCTIAVQTEDEEEQIINLPFKDIMNGRLDPDVDFNSLIKKAKKND